MTDWIGTPYSYGSNSRRGTDCSGFVTRVFREVYGINLQHSSRAMFSNTKHVAKSEMQTGDLVFFRRGHGPIYHVGIYLKDGKFAHSACNGGVMVSSLTPGLLPPQLLRRWPRARRCRSRRRPAGRSRCWPGQNKLIPGLHNAAEAPGPAAGRFFRRLHRARGHPLAGISPGNLQ